MTKSKLNLNRHIYRNCWWIHIEKSVDDDTITISNTQCIVYLWDEYWHQYIRNIRKHQQILHCQKLGCRDFELLVELTNWLNTFDCLARIDLCMWNSLFYRLRLYLFVIVDLLSPCRIEFNSSKISSVFIPIQYFLLRLRYLIYVIDSTVSVRSIRVAQFDCTPAHIHQTKERSFFHVLFVLFVVCELDSMME